MTEPDSNLSWWVGKTREQLNAEAKQRAQIETIRGGKSDETVYLLRADRQREVWSRERKCSSF